MILVHGGAGRVAPERHERLRQGCRSAAAAGNAILAAGGTSLDAVVAAVRLLEDDPEFNAGTGSVLTRAQEIETDAAVMDGATRRVGAVGAVPSLGHAVALARAVLDDGEHVLLVGAAALLFAAENGIPAHARESLTTERAWRRYAEEAAARASTASASANLTEPDPVSGTPSGEREREGGTVGAVARDIRGHFAVATSTGGTNFKRPGRVGDSPIPGAGTWADTRCAISATGDGEAILRVALARSIAMRAENHDLRRAVEVSLAELHEVTGGEAGVIAVDATGRIALHLTTTMPIAWIDDDGSAGDASDDGVFLLSR